MARLVINDGSSTRTVELSDPTTVAGRSAENKIHIEDKQASRKHFQLEKTEYGVKLVDLESRNGTRVNDRVVNQALLRPGDRITIGKHTLTFEDPAFKEPPADVAARFAPASAGPAMAALPAEKAAPPAGPAPAPGAPEEPRIRRRTGATTSIERVHRIEAAKEKQLVTYVGVGAGVFVFILLVLVMLPSGGESPASSAAKDTFSKAQALFRKSDLDGAQLLLERIPPEQKAWHAQAQGMLKEIAHARTRLEASVSAGEKTAFEEIYAFGEKSRGNPNMAEALVQKCEAFKRNYPKSDKLGKVTEYLNEANESRKASRRGDLAESERQAQDALKRNDYAGSLKGIIAIRDKFKDDLEISERLLKTHDEIIDKAKVYTNKRVSEANEMAARGRVPDAVKILEELVLQMGDGSVDALGDYALRARTTLQGLK